MKGKWKLRDTGWCYGCDASTAQLGKRCSCGHLEARKKGRKYNTRRSRKGLLRKIRKDIIKQSFEEYGDDRQ